MRPLALVAEDDSGTRRLLMVLLTRLGFEVDAVDSGAEALVLLRNLEYAVVVTDLLMRRVDGTSVLAALTHERPELLQRVIVLSSVQRSRLESVRQTYPDVQVLQKPFEVDVFTNTVLSLTAVVPPHAVLTFQQEFCRSSVRAGAKSGIVTRVEDDKLMLVASFGSRSAPAAPHFPLDLETHAPICDAARGQEVWMRSLRAVEHEYPQFTPVWTQLQSNAVAALPVVQHGTITGAVGWTFSEPQAFPAATRQALVTIASGVGEHLA